MINGTEETKEEVVEVPSPEATIEKIEREVLTPVETKNSMKVFKLRAGFPVFTSAPAYNGYEGELALFNDGSTRGIYCYLGGTWYKTDLGSVATVTLTKTLDDHEYAGTIITLTAHENLVMGNVCYIDTDGEAVKALADTEAHAGATLVMALGTIAADATGLFLLNGTVRDDSFTWTVGSPVYLSHSTSAAPTSTIPTGANTVVQILGVALAAHIMYFNPQLVQVVRSA